MKVRGLGVEGEGLWTKGAPLSRSRLQYESVMLAALPDRRAGSSSGTRIDSATDSHSDCTSGASACPERIFARVAIDIDDRRGCAPEPVPIISLSMLVSCCSAASSIRTRTATRSSCKHAHAQNTCIIQCERRKRRE